jgi:hypothetical protein
MLGGMKLVGIEASGGESRVDSAIVYWVAFFSDRMYDTNGRYVENAKEKSGSNARVEEAG